MRHVIWCPIIGVMVPRWPGMIVQCMELENIPVYTVCERVGVPGGRNVFQSTMCGSSTITAIIVHLVYSLATFLGAPCVIPIYDFMGQSAHPVKQTSGLLFNELIRRISELTEWQVTNHSFESVQCNEEIVEINCCR